MNLSEADKKLVEKCGATANIDLDDDDNKIRIYHIEESELAALLAKVREDERALLAKVREDERDRCATVCDARANKCAVKADITDDQNDRIELKANAWQFSVLASEIRSLK